MAKLLRLRGYAGYYVGSLDRFLCKAFGDLVPLVFAIFAMIFSEPRKPSVNVKLAKGLGSQGSLLARETN